MRWLLCSTLLFAAPASAREPLAQALAAAIASSPDDAPAAAVLARAGYPPGSYGRAEALAAFAPLLGQERASRLAARAPAPAETALGELRVRALEGERYAGVFLAPVAAVALLAALAGCSSRGALSWRDEQEALEPPPGQVSVDCEAPGAQSFTAILSQPAAAAKARSEALAACRAQGCENCRIAFSGSERTLWGFEARASARGTRLAPR